MLQAPHYAARQNKTEKFLLHSVYSKEKYVIYKANLRALARKKMCNLIFIGLLSGEGLMIILVSDRHTKQVLPALLSHGVHFTVG